MKNTKENVLNKPIRIIPDANVLFADPFLQNVAAQAIIAANKFMDIKFVFSDVTSDEVRNLVNEQIVKTVAELHKVNKKAKILHLETGSPKYGLGYESKKALDAWEARWTELKNMYSSLPYPGIVPKELALRSIKELRPFLDGDKGFRDCILWISILAAMATDNCDYILVSNDDGFYEGKAEQLHSDLEKDLTSLNLSGRLLARRSLATVVEEFIKPGLKPDQKIEVEIRSGKIPDFTEKDDTVDILINEYLMKTDIPGEWINSGDYYSASYDVAEDITMEKLVSTLMLDDKVLVTSEWEAFVVIEVSCPGYQDESETVIVSFKIESIVDPKTLEVESHEVTDYELKGWWDPETKERIPY